MDNQKDALIQLIDIVKSSTKTMTSVPKPFKFLKTHYAGLTETFDSLEPS